MRHRDVTRLRRMFENVVTAGDTIEGPTLFRQLPDQPRAFHGVYYNHHQEGSQHYNHPGRHAGPEHLVDLLRAAAAAVFALHTDEIPAAVRGIASQAKLTENLLTTARASMCSFTRSVD